MRIIECVRRYSFINIRMLGMLAMPIFYVETII